MGKLNLSKSNKRDKKGSKGKSGIPNWLLTTIIVVIIAAVLATTVLTILNSNGVIMRISDAVESENFEVSGNMMAYFYSNTYNNFTSNYESMLSSLSVGKATSMADHKTIVIGSTTADDTYFSSYKGKTWYDYFMDMTVESVKSMLIYCEEARALNIEYTEDDRKSSEDAVDSMLYQFRMNLALQGGDVNTSEDICFSQMFGTGVKRSDILDAMELSTVAAKCAEKIQNTLLKKITDTRIDKEYSDNKLDYDAIDYFYYEYDVDYEDIVEEIAGKDADEKKIKENKDKIVAEYKKQIEEVKETTAKLAAAKTLDEFKKIVFEKEVNDKYDTLLEDLTLDEKKMPADDVLAVIKEKMLPAVVDEVLKDAEETADDVKETTTGEGDKKTTTYTLYGSTITKEFAKEIRSIRDSLFSAISRINSTYNMEIANYDKSDFAKWAFDKQRKDGETKSFAEGDGASSGEIEVKEKKYSEKVYFLTKAQYKRTEKTRDVAYMLLSSTDTAKKVITELKKIVDGGKTITKDKFNELASKNSAQYNTVVENYVRGNMGSTEFDEWIYGEELKKGGYTATPITMSDGSVMVAFYIEEGDPTWKTVIRTELLNEDFSAYESKMIKKYEKTIEVTEWVLDRVGGK